MIKKYMTKKLFIYIIIGFSTLNIVFTNAYATDAQKTSFPKNLMQIFKDIGKQQKETTKTINGKSEKEKELEKRAEEAERRAKEAEEREEEAEQREEEAERRGGIAEKTEEEEAEEEREEGEREEAEEEKAETQSAKLSRTEYYRGQKTLMYKEENIVKIIQILTSLDKGIKYRKTEAGVEEIVDQTQEIDEILDNAVISVYLNSILYISDNLWSIWANGQKITNKNNDDKDREIKVLSISPERVKFLWSINKIKWDIINANNAISKDVYTVKDEKVNMVFTLEPNQSFVPSLNKIIEGSIKQEERETEEAVTEGKEVKQLEQQTQPTEIQERDLFEFEVPK